MITKMKMTIEFDATEQFLKSSEYKEFLSDIEDGNFEKEIEQKGISNVKVSITEN